MTNLNLTPDDSSPWFAAKPGVEGTKAELRDKLTEAKGLTKPLVRPGETVKIEPLTTQEIERMQQKLGKRIDYYQYFTPESSESRPILSFFKAVRVKIYSLFNICKKESKEAKINHALLSEACRSTPIQTECPRAVALDYMRQFFRTDAQMHQDPKSQEMEEKLDTCLKFTREIDRLQEIKKLNTNNAKVRHLVNEISAKTSALEPGKNLLIPGGWWEEGKFRDGLIEVTKIKDNDFTVRFISTEEAMHPYAVRTQDPVTHKTLVCPHFTFEHVSNKEVFSSISALVELQIPQLVEDKRGTRVDKMSTETKKRKRMEAV